MMTGVSKLCPAILNHGQRLLDQPFKFSLKETALMDVAILDDYQAVAERMADWSQLPSGINVRFFHDHIADEDRLVERLKNFQIVMGMRERTPFPRSVLEQLPELRLLVTAGMGNAVLTYLRQPSLASWFPEREVSEKARLSSPGASY